MRRVVDTPRTLHLIDVDNLLGDPRTTDQARVSLLFTHYRQVADYREGDLAVVATGCNADHVLAVELAWPEARHARRRGPDGADLALLEEADWAAKTRRFERVVLGSGDLIFVQAAERLLAANLTVEVVSRARSLARGLAARMHGKISYLPESLAVTPG
jgi:hypothetical protein